jgi:hypothetical protein
VRSLLVLSLAVVGVAVGACGCDPPPVVDAGCRAGMLGCPCDGDTCDGVLACRDEVCVACSPGSRACPCDDGACEGGDVCDRVSTSCREPTPCEEAGCAQYQDCEQVAGEDAMCLPSCEDGFGFDGDECVPTPSCDPSAPGFVDCGDRVCTELAGAVDCGACGGGLIEIDGECVTNDCSTLCGDNRECEVGDAGTIGCGLCDPGFVNAPGGAGCVAQQTCDDITCQSNEVCIESTVSSPAECRVRSTCAPNEVETEQGACVDCAHCFEDDEARTPLPGVAGVGNAGFAAGSVCVCELESGWFQSIDGEVKRCDNDGDGWTNADIVPVLRLAEGNNPFAREQRCGVRRIDRFELRSDDWVDGLATTGTREVTLAEVAAAFGLQGGSAFQSDPSGAVFVELIEPQALDAPAEFERRYVTLDPALRLREYGDANAPDAGPAADPQLTPAEVNPLTKACNHEGDDLNLDGVPDVSQFHGAYPSTAPLTALDAMPVFHGLAYFLELNRGWFEPGTPYGRYVIAEKKRVSAAGDPLELELAGPTGPGTYWQQCLRSRRGSFDVADKMINHDFGLWSECATDAGACEVAAGGVGYDGRALRPEKLGVAVADLGEGGAARFAGMNHSSQFACLSWDDDVPEDERHRRADPSLTPQLCRRVGASAGAGANPADPDLECAPVGAPHPRERYSYWAALPQAVYDDPSEYPGGCIDEGIEWARLCVVGAEATAADAHGKLFCGCGPNRTGADCEIGCAASDLFSTRRVERTDGGPGGASQEAFRGVWLCGGLDTTPGAGALYDPTSGFRLQGGVRSTLTPIGQLCENDGGSPGCSVGFSLSAPPPRGTP